MPSRLGPRFAIEAAFLVAVAVAVGFADLSAAWIVIVMAAAWLLVAIVEWLASRADRPALVVRRPEAQWPGAGAPEPAVVEPHPGVTSDEVQAEDADHAPAPAVAEALVVVEEIAVVEEVAPAPAGWAEPSAPEEPPFVEPDDHAAPAEEAEPADVVPAAPEPMAAPAEPEGASEEAPVAHEPVETPEEQEDRPRAWWRRRPAEALAPTAAAESEPPTHEQAAEEPESAERETAEAAEREAEPVAEDRADEAPGTEPEAPRRSLWRWKREPEPQAADAPSADTLAPEAGRVEEPPTAGPSPGEIAADEAVAASPAEGPAAAAVGGAAADPWLEPTPPEVEGLPGEEGAEAEPETEKPRRRRLFGRSRDAEKASPSTPETDSEGQTADVAASGIAESPVEGRVEPQGEPVKADAAPKPPRRAATAPRGGVFRRYPQPREWSLWELERAVREHGGSDAKRKREWNVTLMHLRQYANARGTLPVELDPLVRETFGDLIDSRGR